MILCSSSKSKDTRCHLSLSLFKRATYQDEKERRSLTRLGWVLMLESTAPSSKLLNRCQKLQNLQVGLPSHRCMTFKRHTTIRFSLTGLTGRNNKRLQARSIAGQRRKRPYASIRYQRGRTLLRPQSLYITYTSTDVSLKLVAKSNLCPNATSVR
jgi:hypothetical protein